MFNIVHCLSVSEKNVTRFLFVTTSSDVIQFSQFFQKHASWNLEQPQHVMYTTHRILDAL